MLLKSKVSLVVPTYKERDNIVPLAEQLHRVLAGYDYEMVLVDDDSGDGSVEMVASLAKQYPVRMVVRRNERGLATAIVYGLAHIGGELVVVIDADLQHPPEVIPRLLEALDSGADIAVASRYIPGGGCEGWGLTRRLISRVATILAHLFLPSTRAVKDPMSGFFAFRRSVVAGVSLQPIGYKVLLELLVLGKFQHVVEVPYIFKTRSRGQSKLNPRQQIDYLKHICRLMRRTGELWRFVKFCLVGLSGVVVNEGLLWILTEFVSLFYLVSAAIGIETSIISNFILNDRFTFGDRRSTKGNPFLSRLAKFNLVSLAGVGINLGILWLLTQVFGLHYLLSNLVGIAFAFLWNYLVNTWWTWR